MKKLTRILTLALALVLIAAALVACAKKEPVEGTYVIKTINGETVEDYMRKSAEDAGATYEEYTAMLQLAGVKADFSNFIVLTLNADGTMTLETLGETNEGTWTQKDANTITLTGTESRDCAYKNGVLTLEMGDMTVEMEKTK